MDSLFFEVPAQGPHCCNSQCPTREKWNAAATIGKGLGSLHEMGVWEIVGRPPDKKFVGSTTPTLTDNMGFWKCLDELSDSRR